MWAWCTFKLSYWLISVICLLPLCRYYFEIIRMLGTNTVTFFMCFYISTICIFDAFIKHHKDWQIKRSFYRLVSDLVGLHKLKSSFSYRYATPQLCPCSVCMYVCIWCVNVFLDTCTTITTTRRTGSSRLTTTPTLWWRTFATCCSPTTPASPYFSAASSSPTWSRATWAAELVMFYRRRPFVASPQKVKTENLYEESK